MTLIGRAFKCRGREYGADTYNKDTTDYLKVIDLETKNKDAKSTEDMIDANGLPESVDEMK